MEPLNEGIEQNKKDRGADRSKVTSKASQSFLLRQRLRRKSICNMFIIKLQFILFLGLGLCSPVSLLESKHLIKRYLEFPYPVHSLTQKEKEGVKKRRKDRSMRHRATRFR